VAGFNVTGRPGAVRQPGRSSLIAAHAQGTGPICRHRSSRSNSVFLNDNWSHSGDSVDSPNLNSNVDQPSWESSKEGPCTLLKRHWM
jgi:hypothetical protein